MYQMVFCLERVVVRSALNPSKAITKLINWRRISEEEYLKALIRTNKLHATRKNASAELFHAWLVEMVAIVKSPVAWSSKEVRALLQQSRVLKWALMRSLFPVVFPLVPQLLLLSVARFILDSILRNAIKKARFENQAAVEFLEHR